MEYFAGYGFNKSHSTAYALLAVSDGVPEGELSVALRGGAADDRSAEHRQAGDVPGECRDRGIPVLPPDINESQLQFSVDAGRASASG